MSDICRDMLSNRLRGYPCFLLAGDRLRNAPSESPLLYGHFPKRIRNLVKAAEKVSNTLWALPKESPIPFRYFSNGLHDHLDTFPVSLSIIWAFPLHFPQSSAFLLIKIINQRLNRKI
jgi:hypothetical protein